MMRTVGRPRFAVVFSRWMGGNVDLQPNQRKRAVATSVRTDFSSVIRRNGFLAHAVRVAVLASCGLAGCGAKVLDEATGAAAFERMNAVGNAYRQATAKRGSPPRSAEDLREVCPAGVTTAELLMSPADNEPITVFWGTDPNSGMDVNPLVLAHEKTGGPAGRFVLTTMGVMLMPAETFAKARFPDAPRAPSDRATKTNP